MTRRGPKPTPDRDKILKGTFRRHRARTGPDFKSIERPVEKPAYLTRVASEIWDEKVARYEARRQQTAGFEAGLAQFCMLEAEILLQTGDEEKAGDMLAARLAAAAAEDGGGAGTRALVADAWFNAGAQAERRRDIERAERYLRRAIEIDPEHAAALNYLGYTWADGSRNLDEALGLLQRAVALDAENGAYRDSLGWVYYRLGRLEEAREHLLMAMKYEADDPTIREHLGDHAK